MIALVILLLLIWIAAGVVGLTIKGLVWLALVALILFLVTAVVGSLRYWRR